MSDTDFAALIEPVARHFWGEPNPKLSSKTELRWGSQGSRAIFLDGVGNWKDFEGGNDDGTVIGLVMAEMRCDKAAAIRWLETQDFIPKRHSGHSAPHQRQERAAQADELEEASSPAGDDGIEYEVEHDDYSNRDGEFQYRVIRYQYRRPDGSIVIDPDSGKPKKTFKQKSRDAQGKITFGLNGRAPCLYRWPQVEQAIAEGKPIILVEGERKARTAVALGWESTTNSGGAGNNFTDEMAATFRGAHVVILPDNDPQATKKVRTKGDNGEVIETRELRFHKDGRPVFPGQDHADAVAVKLRDIAASVKVLELPGLPLKGDIVEWVKAGGTAEQLQALIDACPPWRPRPPVSKFGAVNLRDIGTGLGRKHTWLVQDMIELGGSCGLAGFSQSGKSFLTIKLTFAIVMGEPFFGRDVKQGMVVYQLGEGEAGFEKRIEGFMKDKGMDSIDGLPLVILPRKINLFASDEDTDALIAEIKAWTEYHDQPCRMVVIDTFNKATRGANEINGTDMGKIIDRVERIAAATGATVMVIDHLSMGGRIRGHGSKTDDMTNTIRVEKDEKKVDNNGRAIRHMILSKNKDGEAGGKVPFVLRQVVNGFDDAGRPITTCVVDPPDGNEEELERSGRLSLPRSFLLQTIRDVIGRDGFEAPSTVPDVPKGRHVVPWKAVMTELRRKWQYKAPENEPEKREIELQRIITDAGRALQNNGYIDRDNTAAVVWWTGKTDRPIPKTRPIEPAGAGISTDVKKELADMGDVPF